MVSSAFYVHLLSMKLLGIDFIPLNTPLKQRLQRLAAAVTILLMTVGGFVFSLLVLFLLFTRFWYLTLFYITWLYFDRHISEKGGRPIKWVYKWKLWQYASDFYPLNLELVPDFTLDPKHNYLFACFPHGILPQGPSGAIYRDNSPFRKSYPDFRVKTAVLNLVLLLPIAREVGLGLGFISCSAKSIRYVLNKEEGGHIVLLWPGGAAEALNSRPGHYKLVVKRRKGFIRLALENGTPLVPVISFGETDLYRQFDGPILKKIQNFILKTFGFAFVLVNGCGFFQNSFGLVPRQVPVTTVVGRPIHCIKTDNPSAELIEEVHTKFVEDLKILFEKYKYKYLKNAENVILELE